MDSFGEKGTYRNVPDAMAALALVRALIRNLKNKGIVGQEDINSIVTDALAQFPSFSNEGINEARRLIHELEKIEK